jgi:hypothetical protein
VLFLIETLNTCFIQRVVKISPQTLKQRPQQTFQQCPAMSQILPGVWNMSCNLRPDLVVPDQPLEVKGSRGALRPIPMQPIPMQPILKGCLASNSDGSAAGPTTFKLWGSAGGSTSAGSSGASSGCGRAPADPRLMTRDSPN